MLAKNLPFGELIWKIPFRIILDIVAAFQALIKGNGTTFISIVHAQMDFLEWIFIGERVRNYPKIKMKNLGGVYKGSVAWEYFISKKRTFSEIVNVKE